MVQVQKTTHDEKVKMYKQVPIEKLIEMLISSNKLVEEYAKAMRDVREQLRELVEEQNGRHH